jgi:hypothetical protein
MPLICGDGEAEYFSQRDWTGRNSLIRQDKSGFRRISNACFKALLMSRFEVQMAGGLIEVRIRGPKK